MKRKYPKRINIHQRILNIQKMIGWTDEMKTFAIKDIIQNFYRRRERSIIKDAELYGIRLEIRRLIHKCRNNGDVSVGLCMALDATYGRERSREDERVAL